MRKKPGYLKQVKQNNVSSVLKTIWKYEPVSRIELVEKTELTSGTVTNLTQELIQAGLIRESETSAGGVGRKRVMLRFDAERYRLIGIDIGRTSCEAVLTDLSGRVISSSDASTVGMNDPHEVLDLLAPTIEGMRDKAAEQGKTVLGIGVSIPGPMDLARGVLLQPPNFPGWDHFPIRDELEKRFETKVLINDDARTCALAERWFGLGRQEDNLVHITMGMGIGGGVVLNGEILYGANGLYGQIGHIGVDPEGRMCACGNRGCWETVGSIPGMLRSWLPDHETRPIGDFFLAVSRGDTSAVRTLNDSLSVMSSALTTLFNVYDPNVIILGGKLFPYLAKYLPEIRERVQERVYSFVRNRVRIEASTFGTSQSAVGAAALVFDRLIQEPLHALKDV